MLRCEEEAGITYAEVGIDLRNYRGGRDFKTFCPKCHGTRRNKSDKSLSVQVEEGQWRCHNRQDCDWHSGLGIEARNRRGGLPSPTPSPVVNHQRSEPTVTERQYSTPNPDTIPAELHPWAIEWLKSRGITQEVARSYGVRSSGPGEPQAIYLPYYLDGKLVNFKKRSLPKQFSQHGGAARTLYNIDRCQDADHIVVVEGEMDVLACAVAGWEAVVSTPDGAGEGGRAFAAFEEPTAKPILAQARRIIIATDSDEPGTKYGDALVSHFGEGKCWRVQWPEGCKDANDVLVKHGSGELDRVLTAAAPVPLPGVRPLSTHRESLLDIYDNGFAPGVSTGWPDFDFLYRPVPGELVIVSGYPSHGKTSWLNHFLVNLAQVNDFKIALYSPEQGSDGEVLGKFVQIVADAPYLPTADKRVKREALDYHINWVGERFWEIHAGDKDDGGFASLTVPQILANADPLAMRNGLDVLVIDPWNECESARPKHMSVEEYISSSLSTIRGWCKRSGVTAILVIHPRKPDSIKSSEDSAPHPFEAAGAAHWYNKADVFITVHRVKHGEEAGKTTVEIKKHRKEGITGELGSCEFKYDRRSGRFYCMGTQIPDRVGANPYGDLPDDLLLSPRPETVFVDVQAPMDWDEIEA